LLGIVFLDITRHKGEKATGLLLSRGGSRATERSTIETTSKPFVGAIKRTYKLFLELPAMVVLAALWFAGAVLIGACALALYLLTP
jgi:hypothetical protein